MGKSLAIWQTIIGVLVVGYYLLGAFLQGSAYNLGYYLGGNVALVLLGIFALITGISNLKKK